MSKTRTFVIGSRGSQLALWQANWVKGKLGAPAEIRQIRTSGDRLLDVPLQGQLAKGFFTKEIEEELLAGRIDMAVHSLKDLPATLPQGLMLGAVLERSTVSDILLVHPRAVATGDSFPVKPGSKVGTSSLRRQALQRHFAPNLTSVFLRGNVPTRLEKCKRGDYDAIIVARTGLERLKLIPDPLVTFDLSPDGWLSAPGQGALAVEVRAGDQELLAQLAPLDHAPTRQCVELERRLLVSFGAGCSAPFSAWAELDGEGAYSVHVGLAEESGAWRSVFLRGNDPNQLIATARQRLSQGEAPTGEVRKDICRPARPWY